MMESESTALPLGYTPKWYSAERFRLATYIVYHIPQGLSRKKAENKEKKSFLVYHLRILRFVFKICG